MKDKLSKQLDIQNSIAQAMKILAGDAVKKEPHNKTEVGIISRIVNPARGIYKVKFQDLILTCYSISNSSYQINDSVYILIPNNDLQNQIFILGKTGGNILSYNATFVQLTEAEYNALSLDEQMNGTIYFLTDAN